MPINRSFRNKNEFVNRITIFSWLLIFLARFSVAATPVKPNVVLIFADDIGYEGLGAYGGLDFKTPHLDQMAKAVSYTHLTLPTIE